MIALSEFEEDALKEMFNIALGNAVSSLSELVDAEVGLSVPCVNFWTSKYLASHVDDLSIASICSVAMPFRLLFSPHQVLDGKAVLLMRAGETHHLLNALYGTIVPFQLVDQVAKEAVTDVTQVQLYTCLSTFSGFWDAELDAQSPIFHFGYANLFHGSLIDPSQKEEIEETRLSLQIDFSIQGKEVAGSILVWFNNGQFDILREKINLFACNQTI